MDDDTPKRTKGKPVPTTVFPIRRQLKDFAIIDGPGGPPTFGEPRQLIAQFRAQRPPNGFLAEVEFRLEQIEWIVTRIASLHQNDPAGDVLRYRDYLALRSETEVTAVSADELEITTLCEAFYYLAFRLITVAERARLTNVKDAARGVVIVRNHLLEHPERHISRGWSFAYGGALPDGPVLRPFGVRSAISEDVGLYANARELIEALKVGLRV